MNRPVLPVGAPRAERADAVRNRVLLLSTAREMIAERGVEKLTMDALAERAGLGKGTVFRRFGSRAGIFHALLDDAERALQEEVLSGPEPLGPGADPVERLVAYGRARIAFQLRHHAIARAALDGSLPVPAGERSMSRIHIRVLLGQAPLPGADLDMLAVQLTAALEGPFLLYLAAARDEEPTDHVDRMARAWQDLVERVCRA
ncbi:MULTISPECIES: TetR/AcrR family transcriptional regulator [unclassified Streptomyces]|uniref:TetR/AcrR family transcriptional regulator n=1 Tax=unclassified Streptomyces TaxID=2593676 RepID=UPI000DC7D20B|nr:MULTISPECIES: TetR/AcrR family transcriptional regulator [unclassified Streptomyces]AWZ10642.1 TetR/AcrR family transcriptional regulator [Streptomyces sp. ICC4]AWZ18503.1 TetR/AcrR family transcriptional regulator [Streptomyces sp. ICC1]